MSKRTKTLLAILGIVAAGISAIFAINKLISKFSISKNLLHKYQSYSYKWRFGIINYFKEGTGSPILLIHELTPCSNAVEWIKIVDQLSEKHTIYAIDLPGCGLSDKANQIYTNYYYVQLIRDFINQVIGEPTIVMATGLSASFAVTTCNCYPDSIKKLLLVNPTSLKRLKKIPNHRSKMIKKILDTPIFGTFIYNMIISKKNIRKEFERWLFTDMNKIPEDLIDVYYESGHTTKGNGKYLFSSILANYAYIDISHALSSVNKEIIILSGEEQERGELTIREYEEINPSIKTMIIPDTKHLPQIEDPKGYLDIISEYID